MKVIEKYLDTKNKKIAAGVTAAVIIAAVGVVLTGHLEI